jgi:hypothetical protein
MAGSFVTQFNATLAGTNASDIVVYTIAGAINGMTLAWMYQRQAYWGWMLVAGTVSYAVTKFAERLMGRILGNTTGKLYSMQAVHLIIAGLVNGAVFMGLSQMYNLNTVSQILAGAVAFYFFDFVAWVASLASIS